MSYPPTGGWRTSSGQIAITKWGSSNSRMQMYISLSDGNMEAVTMLSLTAKQHLNEAVPAIRALFPNPIKMLSKGKSKDGISLYSMSGEIALNQAMA